MEKIVIYGGTFSPPHIGHVNVARAIEKSENPDKLLIIPTYISPHKSQDQEATPEQRLEMCRLAFSSVECACVSDMEIKREGKSYTYLTLKEICNEERDVMLVCGTDMILTFDCWYMSEEIFKMATIAYVRRENDDDISRQIESKLAEYRDKYNANIKEIKIETIEMSSSEIREKIAKNIDVSDCIPESVKDYIEKWKIYRI